MENVEKLVYYTFFHKPSDIDELNFVNYCALYQQMIDRTNPAYFDYGVPPIPAKECVALEDAIKDATKVVKEKSQHKHIYLLWSGGIDSTVVLFAMLDAGIPFTVIMNENSVKEYPMVAKKILAKEFSCDYFLYQDKMKPLKEVVPDFDNAWFVTGEIGDQLSGSMITMRYTYEQRSMSMAEVIKQDLFTKPYEVKPEYVDGIPPLVVLKHGDYNTTELCVRYCEKPVYKFLGTDRETTTLSEFLWAVNFIYKYTLVILRLFKVGLWNAGSKENCTHFFDTVKFQQWAMDNYKSNCAYVKDADYKMPFKEYIYRFTNDAEYRDEKEKVPSLKVSPYWSKDPMWNCRGKS